MSRQTPLWVRCVRVQGWTYNHDRLARSPHPAYEFRPRARTLPGRVGGRRLAAFFLPGHRPVEEKQADRVEQLRTTGRANCVKIPISLTIDRKSTRLNSSHLGISY